MAVISYGFWQRAYGGDSNVLDRLTSLRGVKFRIVGVMPAGFTGIDPGVPNEVMLPFAARQLTNPAPFDPDRWGSCSLVARLDPAVPAERARPEAVVHQFIEAHPPKESYGLPRLWMTDVSRGMDSLRTATSRPLLILFSMVIATLLIACANVTGLIEEARGHAIGIDQLLA